MSTDVNTGVSTYVYGITRPDHPLRLTDRGVGPEPAPLRVVRGERLAAVVSDAPENLRPKRRDLEAHERVLESLIADGTVLPMRFGAVAADDESVRRELDEHTGWYDERLEGLAGRREVNVKAFHHEQAVLSELLRTNPELREANEALRGDADQDRRIDFGERVVSAMGGIRDRDAAQVLAVLKPYAADLFQAPPVDGGFLNVSVLVDEDKVDDLRAAVEELGRRAAEVVELRVSDPLPPYSFVTPG